MLKSIPLKYTLPLFGLTVSAFVFNTSEFMPIGLLMDIAASFSLTEAQTGVMITVYAWVVALLSLPLMLLASHISPRRLLLGTMVLFSIGQLLSGLALNFPMLMGARIFVACAHAVFWSIAAPFATRLVTRTHRPLALSMVAVGSSIAMIFGLPLGRIIGLYAGWRMTFLLIAGVTLLLIIYLAFSFPSLTREKPFSVMELPALLRQPLVLSLYIMAILFSTGYFTIYSYIEPFLKLVAAFSDGAITTTLMCLGLSGLIGSFFFSRLYGPYRQPVIISAMIILIVAAALWHSAASLGIGMILVALTLGLANALFNMSFQAELIRTVSLSAAPIAMSIFSGLVNVGIGGGSWLGGRVIEMGILPAIGYVGGGISLLAFIYCLVFYFPLLQKFSKK